MTPDASRLSRRGFLGVGGVSVGLVAVAAACVNTREPEQLTQTGTRVPAPSTSAPPFPGTAVLDARMVLTALSVERLAIDTYDNVLKQNWLVTSTTAELARRVLDRHRAHAAALVAMAAPFGQDVGAVKANEKVKKDLVDNQLDKVTAATTPAQKEVEAVNLLAMVEDTLAQFYARATGLVTTADLRASMGGIGGATARQYTAFAEPAALPPAPVAFMPTAPAAIPEDNYVVVDESSIRTPGTLAPSPGTAAPGTTR